LIDPAFQRACEAAAERWEVPALAIGISVDETRETSAVGCDVDTTFRIASITKPFTATLALALLDLEAPTGVWPDDVRVRHLLSHTSGFDCECGDLARFGDGDDALASVVRELPSVRRWVGVEEAWSYANTGYWLAGWLCEGAAGTTYEDALAQRLLGPLGLDATSFGDPAVGGTGHGAETARYPRARRASGGLVSNVGDLLQFGESLLRGERTAVMWTVHGKPAGGVYGLGFFGERVGGVDVWGHGGSYGGFESSLLLVPSRGAVFVGLTNSGRGSQALREVEDVFFERAVGSRRAVPSTAELDRAALDAFAGSYANSELRAAIAVDGTGLVLELVELDRATGAPREVVSTRARPIGPRTFECLDGDVARARFDYPLPGFARIGSRLAERVV
jgi:CubicO group peptidase (beta-lactamase class C family)